MKWIVYCLIVFLFFQACKKSELLPNEAPETKLFLDSIALTGQNRLNSIVHMHWSGEDKDGVVIGFEYSLDGNQWFFTTKSDSVFQFNLTSASDTSDIQFYIRAIDDKQTKDPSPASLNVPIRNTAPIALFDTTSFPVDSVLSVLTFQFTSSDFDGNETIDSLFLRANSGNWVSIPVSSTMISLVPSQPGTAGSNVAKMYREFNTTALSTEIPDLKVDDWNTIYIKAKDIGGLESFADTSKAIFIKKQNSSVLVIDGSPILPRAADVYLPAIQTAFGSLDYLDFNRTSVVPKYLNPSLALILSLHQQVIWFGTPSVTQLDIVEKSETVIQNYLNKSGKLFFAMQIPKNISTTSVIYRFSPIDSLTKDKDAFMLSTGYLRPDPALVGYPDLKATGPGIISAINPFYPKASATIFYRADLTKSGSAWTDSTVVMAGLQANNGKINQIFSVIPLEKVNGNMNLSQFFTRVKTEFDW